MDLLRFIADRASELRLLIAQHVVLVLAATAVAVAIGVPLGLVLTQRPRLARLVLGAAGIVQTIPSLALFGFLLPLPFIGGIGARTAIVALIVYALLPILRNTYVGVRQVDPAVLEAATAMGMTPGERLRMVEVPLALPVILGGVRIATVVSVGTATIAAAIGAGGLGTYVFRGLATMDTRLVLAGAIPAAVLAVAADGLLARVERSRRPARGAWALAALVVVILAWAALDAASGPSRRRLVVVSKNFTEQVVLGEIVAATLERAGLPVDRRLNLGGTALCHQALLTGQADVVCRVHRHRAHGHPEGTDAPGPARGAGNRPRALPRARPDGRRAARVQQHVRAGHAPPACGASRHPDDLRPAPARGSAIRVGLFGEFLEREDGLPGLVAAYELRFGPPPREMDLGLLYQALLADQVDLVVGAATDGLIAAHDLVVLEDDRRYFPPYDAVIIARADGMDRDPVLREALAGLAGRIDAPAMRRMNLAVDGAHRSPAEVAREFLEAARPKP